MAMHEMVCGACGGAALVLSPARPSQSKEMRCGACIKRERERDMATLRETTKDNPGIPLRDLTVAGRAARRKAR